MWANRWDGIRRWFKNCSIRTKKWVFKIDGMTHRVDVRHKLFRSVRVNVDDEEITWEQSRLLDLLDFGGRFQFVLRSGSRPDMMVRHDCILIVNFLHLYLFVDGKDVETDRRFLFSTFRFLIRFFVIALLLLLLWYYIRSHMTE